MLFDFTNRAWKRRDVVKSSVHIEGRVLDNLDFVALFGFFEHRTSTFGHNKPVQPPTALAIKLIL